MVEGQLQLLFYVFFPEDLQEVHPLLCYLYDGLGVDSFGKISRDVDVQELEGGDHLYIFFADGERGIGLLAFTEVNDELLSFFGVQCKVI